MGFGDVDRLHLERELAAAQSRQSDWMTIYDITNFLEVASAAKAISVSELTHTGLAFMKLESAFGAFCRLQEVDKLLVRVLRQSFNSHSHTLHSSSSNIWHFIYPILVGHRIDTL